MTFYTEEERIPCWNLPTAALHALTLKCHCFGKLGSGLKNNKHLSEL